MSPFEPTSLYILLAPIGATRDEFEKIATSIVTADFLVIQILAALGRLFPIFARF